MVSKAEREERNINALRGSITPTIGLGIILSLSGMNLSNAGLRIDTKRERTGEELKIGNDWKIGYDNLKIGGNAWQ